MRNLTQFLGTPSLKLCVIALAALTALLTAACSGPGGAGVPAIVTGVTIDPPSATVERGNTQSFSATVVGTGNLPGTVVWSIYEAGTHAQTMINTDGVLHVAAGETLDTLTIRATSTFNVSVIGVATVTVTGEIGSGDPNGPGNGNGNGNGNGAAPDPGTGNFTISFGPDIEANITGPTISLIGLGGLPQEASVTVSNPARYDSIRWFFNGQDITWAGNASGTYYETFAFDYDIHGDRIGTHNVTAVAGRDGIIHSKRITFTVKP